MAVTDTNDSYDFPRLRTFQNLTAVPMWLSLVTVVLSLLGDTTEPLFASASLVFIVSSAIIGSLSVIAVFWARIAWRAWFHWDIVAVITVVATLAIWIPVRSQLTVPW